MIHPTSEVQINNNKEHKKSILSKHSDDSDKHNKHTKQTTMATVLTLEIEDHESAKSLKTSGDHHKNVVVPTTDVETQRQETKKEEKQVKRLFGLKMSEPEELNKPWEKEEYMNIPVMLFFLACGVIMGFIAENSDNKKFKYIFRFPDPESEKEFRILVNFGMFIVIWLGYAIPGYIVQKQILPIELVRKINHILVHIQLFIFADAEEHEGIDDNTNYLRNIFLALVWMNASNMWNFLFSFSRPMRKINKLSYWGFAMLDRPEDRPNTLMWLVYQSVILNIVYGPYVIWTTKNNYDTLFLIPFFACALGDGLAEIVGKIFGKHKYQVKGLFSTKKFNRSIEGSACVYFFTLVGVLCAIPDLNTAQFILLAVLTPITTTFLEAKSPHTFDNGFIVAGCWLWVWVATEFL